MSKQENALAIFSRGSQMLAEATTVQQNKELKILGITAAEWARRKGLGEEAVATAFAFALDAERQLGRLLKDAEKAKGCRPSKAEKTGTNRVPVLDHTLAELGVTKKESAAAQKLAKLPEKVFQAVRSRKATRTQVYRELQRDSVERAVAPIPKGKYRVLYADPPWKYGDQLTESYGATKFHYPTMSISELCALPISDLALPDAVLFIWVTSPILPECFAVVEAWGFEYKSSFVWDKVAHNMGHYNSVRHEFLLICTRGSCLPDSNRLVDSVQTVERSSKHSEKPEKFRAIIDEMYKGPRIELFARTTVNGWKQWGNECTHVA